MFDLFQSLGLGICQFGLQECLIKPVGQREALIKLWFKYFHHHVDRLWLFFKTLFWRKVNSLSFVIIFKKFSIDLFRRSHGLLFQIPCQLPLQKIAKNFIILVKKSKGKCEKQSCIKVWKSANTKTLQKWVHEKQKSKPTLYKIFSWRINVIWMPRAKGKQFKAIGWASTRFGWT